MTRQLPVARAGDALATLDEQVAAALQGALAANTWRAYAVDWRSWSAWAARHELAVLPARPLDLARYLVAHAQLVKVNTLTRRMSAVAKAHALAGHAHPTDDPAVREVLRGLRRAHGTAKRGARPLWASDVERIVAGMSGTGLLEVRDRALLLLAIAAALRRSELAALDVADLTVDPAGLVVRVRRSKTDQDGAGAIVGVPTPRGRSCARSSPSTRGSTPSPPPSTCPGTSSPGQCSARSTGAAA